MQHQGPLSLIIPGRLIVPVRDIAHASGIYADERAASGEGGSTFPDGKIMAAGKVLARVSYNAKVWAPNKWTPGAVPLFDPYAQQVAA